MKPRVSLKTKQKLLQLGWEVLIYPPSALDIAPLKSIYFSRYQILLMEKNSNSLEDCKRHLEQFFAQKDKRIWEDGITKLLKNGRR